MVRFAFAVPGSLKTPTGGYAYARRLVAEAKSLRWQVEVIDIGGEFPRPSEAARKAAHKRLAAVPASMPLIIDGLAFGVLDDVAQALAPRHPLIALVHHPLALETGLSRLEADAFRRSERLALTHVRHAIVTSPTTARILATDYEVALDRITVAPPGNDEAPLAQGSRDDIVRLLSVGAIVPRKGFDVLVAALAGLPPGLPWQLTIVGDRTRDPATVKKLDADIARLGLGKRIACTGAVSARKLAKLYRTADIFVLASRFEGYGMAYAEALRHGLPVIGSEAGAIPETVPSGAGLLVPPDHVPALAQALRSLIESPDRRHTLTLGAREAARRLPTWRDTAKAFATALEKAR